MSSVRRFAYAQVRLQANHARFPDENGWRRLEATTSPGHLLNSLRNGPMRPWVLAIDTQMDPHRLEQTVRNLLREHIDAVASWQPREWQAAVHWSRTLLDLPALEHLVSQPTVPHWIRRDPTLRPYALDNPGLRLQALADSEYAPMLDARLQGEPLTRGWVEHWRSLWPPTSATERGPLEALVRWLSDQRVLLGSGQLHESRPARHRLLDALVPAFRRHSFQPAAAFLHLTIAAVHLERLRGTLLRLLLFGGERAA